MTKRDKSWKGLDMGFIDAKFRDGDGRVIWGFKSRGRGNAADGICAMAAMMMEKYNVDVVSLIEEYRREEERLNASLKEKFTQK